MNLEFNWLSLMIALAWGFSLPFSCLPTVAIALLIFCTKSVPMSILLLISLQFLAFIQASIGGRKSHNGCTQKKFWVSLFGLFLALFGSALQGHPLAYPFLFFGLLISMTSGLSLLFFSHHYEQLRLKSYLNSSLLPTLVAISVLLKFKLEMKQEYAQLWDVSLMVLGLFTFLYANLLAVTKDRLKSMLIYWSQAAVGMLLFLSVIDFDNLNQLSFAAIAISAVTSTVLLSLGWQLGKRHFAFAKMAALGLPGMVGLTAHYFSIRMTIGLNLLWLLLLGVGYAFGAATLILAKPGEVTASKGLRFRFWWIAAIQLATGLGLYFLEKGGIR